MKYANMLLLIMVSCTNQSENSPNPNELSANFIKGIWKGDPDYDGIMEEWVFLESGNFKLNHYAVSGNKPTYSFTTDRFRWEFENKFVSIFTKDSSDYQLDYRVEIISDDSIKLTKGGICKPKNGKYYRYFWNDGGIDTSNNFIRVDNGDTIEYSHEIVNGIYSDRMVCNYNDNDKCDQLFDTSGDSSYIFIGVTEYQVGHHPLKRLKKEIKATL